jgi:hypothetical protein
MIRRLALSLVVLMAPVLATAQNPTEGRTLKSFERDKADWPLKDVAHQRWHYAMTMTMNGATMFAREHETCRDRDAARACNFDRPGSECQAFDLGGTATTQKIRVECKGMKGEMAATWAEDGRSWRGEFLPLGDKIPPGAMMVIEAKYLGPCDAADSTGTRPPARP